MGRKQTLRLRVTPLVGLRHLGKAVREQAGRFWIVPGGDNERAVEWAESKHGADLARSTYSVGGTTAKRARAVLAREPVAGVNDALPSEMVPI